MFHVKPMALMLLLLCLPAWGGGEAARLPGPGVELQGRLYRPDGKGPFPAIVMLHGCSGMWTRRGEPNATYEFWAEHFRKAGYVALLLDSFGPRGEREVCTHKHRRITPHRERAADAHAALVWLAERSDVRGDSIHLLGWSNGAAAVLHAVRPGSAGNVGGPLAFRSAVAFYPGCSALLEGEFVPRIPLLIQAGGADDWTPAEPCRELATRARRAGATVEVDVYEGAYHAFDRISGAVRFRPEVRNPSSPTGWGAHVGPDPTARRRALDRTTAFVQEHR